MKELIEAIANKHREIGGIDIYPPATSLDISAFEKQIGFPLPMILKSSIQYVMALDVMKTFLILFHSKRSGAIQKIMEIIGSILPNT